LSFFFDNDITNEDIAQLDLLSFDGEIRVIDSIEKIDEAINELKFEKALGFDTETKPTFRKGEYHPTALIQLSTLDKTFLFRLNKIGHPKSLYDLLENPEINKYGISIDDDLKDLKKCKDFTPNGFLDVNRIAKNLEITHIGVKKLTAIFLNKRISKNQQTSNWENEELTGAQQKYAATDSWICLKIVDELKSKGYINPQDLI